MLNTPNEWHNEEDNNFNNQYIANDQYADDSYETDGEYDEEYDENEYSDDGEYDEEEYEEDGEEEDDDDGSGDDGDDANKKKIILIATIVIVLLILIGGLFGFKAMNAKKAEVAESQEVVLAPEETAGENGEEVSIDVEFDGSGDVVANNGEETMPQGDENSTMPETPVEQSDGGLQVAANPNNGGLAAPRYDETVTVAIGDVGRKNPFVPKHQPKSPAIEEIEPAGVIAGGGGPKMNFDVIEPPALAPENPNLVRLLNTKVTGILYDNVRPAAIINDGEDERFVKVGETMHGCKIVQITKDRVVIRVGNNVYKSSIGQSLLSEALKDLAGTSVNRHSFKGSM